MNQTVESVEAESALIRSQLLSVGAEIRHRVDPTVLIDAASASFKRRASDVPSFLTKNATPIGMVILGGAMGSVVTGWLLRSPQKEFVARPQAEKVSAGAITPSSRWSHSLTVVVTAISIGLGYVAGMLIPNSPAEERLFGQYKAVLSELLDGFLREHARGMKLAAANLFGASHLSATALLGLAMLAEAFANPAQPAKPDSA